MTPAASPKPRSPAVRGLWTLLTSTVTIVIVLVGNLLIQPRLSERHLRIDDRYILTPEEVALLPPETLAVVLDRTPGQDQRGFRYRLLQLVLERSGRSFALGAIRAAENRAFHTISNSERNYGEMGSITRARSRNRSESR